MSALSAYWFWTARARYLRVVLARIEAVAPTATERSWTEAEIVEAERRASKAMKDIERPPVIHDRWVGVGVAFALGFAFACIVKGIV